MSGRHRLPDTIPPRMVFYHNAGHPDRRHHWSYYSGQGELFPVSPRIKNDYDWRSFTWWIENCPAGRWLKSKGYR